MSKDIRSNKAWWHILPGVLTGIAAIIGAMATLIPVMRTSAPGDEAAPPYESPAPPYESPAPPVRVDEPQDDESDGHDPIPPQGVDHELSGAWDLHLTASAYIDQRGRKRPMRNQAEIRIQLRQKGSEIDGKFLWADVCANAIIKGSRTGNKVDFTMHYRGSCCGGSVARFKGEIVSASAMVGAYEPVSAPASNCNLWWASVSALKGD